ncbi:hypothetical protein [Streptomyces caniscabiei]|uniref:hypothetical protein n=1 Tax=Streptomyces caniscabiei TaxID=2746961 RepID=UPI0018724FB5|nr:hypothetical protein [Streptomyces caniscabiei]MBE4791725.1 hypothetical protein [Streptomyces caniscabiei]
MQEGLFEEAPYRTAPPKPEPPPRRRKGVYEGPRTYSMPPRAARFVYQPPPPRPILTAEFVKQLRREAADAHPDRGGTAEAFRVAHAAYLAAKQLLEDH